MLIFCYRLHHCWSSCLQLARTYGLTAALSGCSCTSCEILIGRLQEHGRNPQLWHGQGICPPSLTCIWYEEEVKGCKFLEELCGRGTGIRCWKNEISLSFWQWGQSFTSSSCQSTAKRLCTASLRPNKVSLDHTLSFTLSTPLLCLQSPCIARMI